MGYKKTDKCIQKAFDDERLFVLMTRDHTAPTVVMEWIKLNLSLQPREKLIEALDCAIEMQNKFGLMMDRKGAIQAGGIVPGITYCICLIDNGINHADGNCAKCNGVIF